MSDSLRLIWTDPEHAVKHAIHFQHLAAQHRHFNLERLFGVATQRFADWLCQMHGDSDLTDILETLCKNSNRWFSLEIGVPSINPLTMTLVNPDGFTTQDIQTTIMMFSQIIVRVLRNLTDMDHTLTESHVYDSTNALKLTFSPELH
ncbi:MAG: hypothetical protein MJZ38_02060 [archaeon]|nr:hypothetical protein [archaeon]